MKRARWKWPPMAKFDALLWLVNQRPLLETLPQGNEAYAELRGSLREHHGAPETLGGNAVYNQLRDLFKEHASDGKYAPDLKLVVRVLAAVTETLPDAVAAPADVAVAMPMESIAPSSPLPTTAAGPAAPLPQYAFSFLLLSFSSPHREGLQHFRFFQLAPHTCSYTHVGLLFAGPSIWAQSSPHSCKEGPRVADCSGLALFPCSKGHGHGMALSALSTRHDTLRLTSTGPLARWKDVTTRQCWFVDAGFIWMANGPDM